ncbi:MAG TPA: energy transducer TonB [Bryobacteraceae bacterium]|jgi:protein TonB
MNNDKLFGQTFVDGVGKTHKSWTVLLSFVAQFAAVGVLVLIPLIWTDVLPKATLVNFLQAPAPPPPPPPPPPPAPVVKVQRVAPRQFDAGRLMAPREIPKQVAMITEDALPPSLNTAVVGGVPGGLPGGAVGGVMGGISVAPPPPPPPPKVVEVKPKDTGPAKIGGNVMLAKRVKMVQPNYPTLAKSARIQGAVHFSAIISKDGTIQKLTLLSGHPLLVEAARSAVLQWVYQPTLLNTEPVDVETDITVNFTLQ